MRKDALVTESYGLLEVLTMVDGICAGQYDAYSTARTMLY